MTGSESGNLAMGQADGLELVEAGLVRVEYWRPDELAATYPPASGAGWL